MRQIGAVVQEAFALPDLPDCLLRGMPVSLHVIVLLPTVWAIGLSQRVDQLQGLTSKAPCHLPPALAFDPPDGRFPLALVEPLKPSLHRLADECDVLLRRFAEHGSVNDRSPLDVADALDDLVWELVNQRQLRR